MIQMARQRRRQSQCPKFASFAEPRLRTSESKDTGKLPIEYGLGSKVRMKERAAKIMRTFKPPH
jgi:hypothetical protein